MKAGMSDAFQSYIGQLLRNARYSEARYFETGKYSQAVSRGKNLKSNPPSCKKVLFYFRAPVPSLDLKPM